jgi:hypothetical protein
VVNRAVYSGTVTYLTRRGRRLAAIVPAGRIAADEAKAREEAVAEAVAVGRRRGRDDTR